MSAWKHLLDQPKYLNCRCRKCNQIIAFKCISTERSNAIGPHGITISKRFSHNNCNIEDDESVYCDLISISNHLIDGITELVYEEEYNEEFVGYKEKQKHNLSVEERYDKLTEYIDKLHHYYKDGSMCNTSESIIGEAITSDLLDYITKLICGEVEE